MFRCTIRVNYGIMFMCSTRVHYDLIKMKSYEIALVFAYEVIAIMAGRYKHFQHT